VALIAHGPGALTANGGTVRAWSPDGTVLWEQTLRADVGRELLAVDGAHLYVGLTDFTLVALESATGTVRWIERIGTLPLAFAAVGGKLYFGGTDHHLHAYDRNGGHDWTYRREYVIGAPVVDDEQIYVALWDNTVVAHSKDGRLQWRKPVAERPSRGPILSGRDLVVVLRSDSLAVMSVTPDKPASARGGQAAPAPAAAPGVEASRNTVKVATPSADGSQVFGVIQLENQVRVVVAYKRTSSGAEAWARTSSTASARRRTPSSIRSGGGAENERRMNPWPEPSTKKALPATKITPRARAAGSS
jgi:hypothetical protein